MGSKLRMLSNGEKKPVGHSGLRVTRYVHLHSGLGNANGDVLGHKNQIEYPLYMIVGNGGLDEGGCLFCFVNVLCEFAIVNPHAMLNKGTTTWTLCRWGGQAFNRMSKRVIMRLH